MLISAINFNRWCQAVNFQVEDVYLVLVKIIDDRYWKYEINVKYFLCFIQLLVLSENSKLKRNHCKCTPVNNINKQAWQNIQIKLNW